VVGWWLDTFTYSIGEGYQKILSISDDDETNELLFFEEQEGCVYVMSMEYEDE
jgi:hypothetical protein